MVPTLYPRLLSAPKSSFFLFGPRGTGKSTWVSGLGLARATVNLLDEALYQRIVADPSVFSGRLAGLDKASWVFVDEIQRLPGLLNEVHRLIEEKRLRFILTGSSARKLRQGGVNLLAGRALVRDMFPLLPEEMGEDFDLASALRHGTLALVAASDEAERDERLAAYVRTYLKEEIKAEALVRNLPGFARFLPIAGLCHAQVINVSSLARDSGVERTTVRGFLDVLEDTLFVFRLPAFEAKLRVRERKHPKLYWVDPGIVRAAKGQLGAVAEEERGALFEGWVAQTLRAYQSYRKAFDEMFYWAPLDARGIEVDFLLRLGREFVAIEAKASSRFRDDHLRGLRAISDLPRVERRLLVYLGTDHRRTPDGIDVVPALEFASLLASQRLV
ncbi:MAG: ATP-binding protein [Candidatus Binatia bacterium]